MNRILRTLSVAGAAVAVVVGLATPDAAGSPPPPPPWQLTASAPTGTTVFFKAHTVGPQPQLAVNDVTNGDYLKCFSSELAGSGTTGTYPSGANIIHILGNTFRASRCVDPSGSFSFSPTGTGNWPYNALTYNSAPVPSGSTTGRLTAIRISWASTPAGCTFVTTGDIKVFYDNNSGNPQIRFVGAATNLTVTSAPGCGSFVAVGDVISLVGRYRLQPTSTSPIYIFR